MVFSYEDLWILALVTGYLLYFTIIRPIFVRRNCFFLIYFNRIQCFRAGTKYPHEEFSQKVERTNCGRADFTTALKLIKGEIWPLTVGKKWRYRYSGGDKSGSKWKGQMRCKAKKQVRVDVPAGSFETYHIVCDTKNYRRQYYVSPELGISVKYKFTRRGGDRFESELVEYTRGGSD